MKKILGIVGSPRKNGNTHIIVSKLLEGSHDTGAQTEILLLGGLTINECDGCHACWRGRECSKHDDMNGLYQKSLTATLSFSAHGVTYVRFSADAKYLTRKYSRGSPPT